MIPGEIILIENITPEEFLEYEKQWDPSANQTYKNPYLYSTGSVYFGDNLLKTLLETDHEFMLRQVYIYGTGSIYEAELDLEEAAQNEILEEYLEDVLKNFTEGKIMVVAWGSEDSQNRNRDRIFIHPNSGDPVGYKLSIRKNNTASYTFLDRAGKPILYDNDFAPLCIAMPGEAYL